MKMKKIIAGVAAAALTASSLAVVNVSADAVTQVQDYTEKRNTLSFSVEHAVTAKSGVDLNDVLPTDTSNTYNFRLYLNGYTADSDVSFYPWQDDNVFNLTTEGLATKTRAKITVTGILKGAAKKDADGNVIIDEATKLPVYESTNVQSTTSTTTKKIERNGAVWEEFYSLGYDTEKKFMDAHELDVGKFSQITEIKISQEFTLPAIAVHYLKWDGCEYYVSVNESRVKPVMYGEIERMTNNGTNPDDNHYKEIFNNADRASGDILPTKKVIVATNVKNNITDVLGVPVDFDKIYTLDGDTGMIGNETGREFEKLLRWVNDLIGNNKGATITFKFAPAAQASGSGMNVLGWGVAGYSTDPWRVDASANGSANKQDIAFAVNARSTALLRQSLNLDGSLSATFDWDTLISASEYTIAGNVSSLSFKLYSDGDNAGKILRDKWNGQTVPAYALLSSITVNVPDQKDVPNGNTNANEEVLTVVDEVSGVKAEGTYQAIRGNGGAILQAVGSLTTSKLKYEVKLLDKDGNAVQPAGEITLTLPIPKDNQGKTIKNGTVAHTKVDGTVENLTILNDYKADGFVKVVTTSLSPFEMEFEEDETTTEAPETTTEAPETTTAAPETTTAAPETTAAPVQAGDKNANTGVAIALVPAVIAAAGVIISKKRK